jgi:serine/threonine-protein kinase
MDRLARERDGRSFRPEWTPDGKRIVFNRTVNAKEELWWQLADGSAPAELLQAGPTDVPQGFVSPDGQWLIYRVGSPGAQAGRVLARSEGVVPPGAGGRRGAGQRVRSDTDLWYRRLSGDTTSKPLSIGGGYVELAPALSPDGRWLAYNSNETGTNQVYVRPFPGAGARKLVSIDGGSEAIWSRDGKTLFYRVGPTTGPATTTGNTICHRTENRFS